MARKARQRLKLLNALIYFSENVLHPGKVKLFKLLYFLDFLHFSETGRSVTGLTYNAWPMGPVPESLNDEWDSPHPDFGQHITRLNRSFGTGKVQQAIKAKHKENLDIFTDREIAIMRALVKKHFRHTAKEMTDASHFESGPWDIVYAKQEQKQAEIPYELALLGVTAKDEIAKSAEEYEELISNYG
jgi:uncharacterized phage-associated protein